MRKIHGLGDLPDPLYRAWTALRNRCNNPNNKDYKNYGARGIKVCKRWDNFLNFRKDMGPHPGPNLTLDRRNTNGDYTKRNCRWVNRSKQTRNRRITKLSQNKAEKIRTHKGSQRAIAKKYGVCQQLVSRIVLGHIWNA